MNDYLFQVNIKLMRLKTVSYDLMKVNNSFHNDFIYFK